jgi:prepilin-type N-terminal cleavage/methylation domain-containing protein
MKKQSGFTLIELAIVLVIIGLLLGGVLKGQELIQSAKIKNVVSDFSSTTVAIYGYQDRYKALPGDDSATVARWTTASPAPTNGDGNNILAGTFTDATSATEAGEFWHHLRLAGFVGGSGPGGPKNAYNGQLGVQDGNDSFRLAAGTGFKGIIVCESDVPDKAAAAIDNQLDDGNPNTGILRAVKQTAVGIPIVPGAGTPALTAGDVYIETGTTYYTMCKSQ